MPSVEKMYMEILARGRDKKARSRATKTFLEAPCVNCGCKMGEHRARDTEKGIVLFGRCEKCDCHSGKPHKHISDFLRRNA